MGHPRLGEKMSRQRLCGDVLLASLMRCRLFVFVKFYRLPVTPDKAAERGGSGIVRHIPLGRSLFKEQSQRVV